MNFRQTVKFYVYIKLNTLHFRIKQLSFTRFMIKKKYILIRNFYDD